MANIVDELVLSMRLDSKQYDDDKKKQREEVKKERQAAKEQSVEQEIYTKRAVYGIREVRNQVVSLGLAFAGASSIKGFISDLLDEDAVTLRVARNLDVLPSKLKAYENAVKTVGGSAGGIQGSFGALNSIFQAFQNGDNSKGGVLAALGLTAGDLRDIPTAMLKLADASQRLGIRRFSNLAGMLGIDQHTINLLEQGRGSLEKLIREKERDAQYTEKDGEAAIKLQKALSDLQTMITGGLRPAVTGLAEAMVDAAKGTGEAGMAAKIALAPWKALGDGIGYVTDKLKGYLAQVGGDKHDEQVATLKQYLDNGEYLNAYRYGMHLNRERHGLPSTPPPPPGGRSGGTSAADLAADSARRAFERQGSGNQASTIQNYLRSQGFSDEQARGIGAGIQAEGGTPTARNPTSGAFGIGQWLGPRKKALISRYGPNPTLQQQLEFLVFELKGGDHGGAAVRGAGDADSALMAYIYRFMRPDALGAAGDMRRGRTVLGGRAPAGINARPSGNRSSTNSSTNNITVYANTNDGRRIGQDIGRELDARTTIVNANSGLE